MIVNGVEAPDFKHAPECAKDALMWFIGDRGDRVWRCKTCKRFSVQHLTPAPRKPNPASAHAGSPYRCRAHPEIRVDRKGKGCPRCADEARRSQRAPEPDPLDYLY